MGVSLGLVVVESMGACQKRLLHKIRGIFTASKLGCRTDYLLEEIENIFPSVSKLNNLLGFSLRELIAHFLPLRGLKNQDRTQLSTFHRRVIFHQVCLTILFYKMHEESAVKRSRE